jgi:SRSO17 transposase
MLVVGGRRASTSAAVVEHLGDPHAVLVVDETGFLKKGSHSLGVQMQYCGTAGRITNCQVGVFLAYASPHGHTFLDRALYLPQSWTVDWERCRAAGFPDDVVFASKPTLAKHMLQPAIAAGVPAAWVTAASVYGDGTLLRTWLETVPIGYVLAVTRNEVVVGTDWVPHHITEYLEQLPVDGWQRLSAGDGAKGPRLFDWLLLNLYDPPVTGWKRWLLFRRSISDPTDVTPYVCFAPATTTVSELVRVAGQRWRIEQCFELAKQEVGLDEYKVRSWTGWYRHITLVCLAHAFLTVVRTHGADPLGDVGKKKGVRISLQQE